MRFVIEPDVLSDGVAWVSRSLSARPIMPVLLGVVIDAQKNGVHLAGYDLETSAKANVVADVKDQVANSPVTANSDQYNQLVATLGKDAADAWMAGQNDVQTGPSPYEPTAQALPVASDVAAQPLVNRALPPAVDQVVRSIATQAANDASFTVTPELQATLSSYGLGALGTSLAAIGTGLVDFLQTASDLAANNITDISNGKNY